MFPCRMPQIIIFMDFAISLLHSKTKIDQLFLELTFSLMLAEPKERKKEFMGLDKEESHHLCKGIKN